MSVPFDVNDSVVYGGRDIYLPKDTSVTAFEDSRVFLFGEFYLNGQPLLSGGSLPSGIEVGVGPTQPVDPGVVLWWNTSAGYGELMVKHSGSWKQIEDPSEVGGQLPIASELIPGIVELATPAEALARTDALRAVTPLCLQNYPTLTYLGNNHYNKTQADTNYVNVSGDTMTGGLIVTAGGIVVSSDDIGFKTNAFNTGLSLSRPFSENPLVEWRHTSGSPRFGFLQGMATGLLVVSEAGTVVLNSNGFPSLTANGQVVTASQLRLTSLSDVSLVSTTHAFQIGADAGANLGMDPNEIQAMNNGVAQSLYLNNDGGNVNTGSGTFSTGGPAIINDTLHINAGAAESAKITGAATAGYLAFYEGGTRRGYVGHFPDNSISIAADAGYVYIRSDGGYIIFQDSGTERMRMDSVGALLVSHTSQGTQEAGCEIRPTGLIGTWVTAAGTPNLWCSRVGAGPMAGTQPFATFRNGGTEIGAIVVYSASSIGYMQTSDYRLKDVLGPITTPIRRIKYLRPWHIRRKEEGLEEDGFLAHEVSAVIPNCVIGEKDEMYPEDHETNPGEPKYQQMESSKMIPLIVASLQELIGQVEILQGKVAALEAG